ncbi:MAG TPA: MgtC/SapB family protein [Candidatus Limnocylindria bacterium]|nr:MgtC/SapB family protein [Candidatus Limnocylindria bacterium]
MSNISDAELLIRLVLAAVFGTLVGIEREVAGHSAGVRTHLLVAVGAAIFTELSFVGFPAISAEVRADTSRVAAQIVSGIGFLGAGAILRYGRAVRGLTTAASIWAVAALGMAAGTGEYGIAVGGTAIVVIALAPMRTLVRRGLGGQGLQMELRVRLREETTPDVLTTALGERAVTVRSMRSAGDEVTVEVTLPRSVEPSEIVVLCAELDGVTLLEFGEDQD